MGYGLAQYRERYKIDHEILGRVSSGTGGDLALKTASKVKAEEFPDIPQIGLQEIRQSRSQAGKAKTETSGQEEVGQLRVQMSPSRTVCDTVHEQGSAQWTRRGASSREVSE